MKQSKLFLWSILFLLFAGCRDKDKKVIGVIHEVAGQAIVNGFASLEHQDFVFLTVNGSAELEDIVVKEKLIVNGSAEIEDCELQDVTINGAASIDDSSIWGLTQVSGKADFESCTLKEVELSCKEAEFDECSVTNILIKEIQNAQQHIILHDTHVKKDVVFESGKGTVKLEGDTVIDGKVVGGKIIT